MAKQLIGIGESIHASIPRTSKIMKELHELGPDAYSHPSEQFDYIQKLIESQADEGAAFIAVNVDAFGETDPALTVEYMLQYVKLVRKYGKGVPICIDSSDDKVLEAGLKDWYDTDLPVAPPLINSIKVYNADQMMPLKKKYDFSFIGLLLSEDKPDGAGGSYSVDELFALAEELFDKAVGQYGFRPDQIYFDSTVFPLAIDMPMQLGVAGYTYRAFETIKKIRVNEKMAGVHFSLGVSNSCRDLPGRKIGIARAYVEKAMEYGLDAGIVNVAHHFGEKPADPELVALVDAYAKMDGSAERTNDAMMLMGQFCMSAKKPAK
ncbi:MAG: dihydropteroate synthase [Anaerohalosphaera sp.]|nr:dihydropteroate synthase [Anaerohalosphaera sp.]